MEGSGFLKNSQIVVLGVCNAVVKADFAIV